MSAVKPRLVDGYMNAEKLDIPALEWAARGRWEQAGCDVYEFVGKYDALRALGVAQAYMLVVGISGKKQGPDYSTQRLANDRFRLELRTNDSNMDALIARAKTFSPGDIPKPGGMGDAPDPMSSCLAKASALIQRYPSKLRQQLYVGFLGGSMWALSYVFNGMSAGLLSRSDSRFIEAAV